MKFGGMMRIARWILGPLAGCAAAIVVVFSIVKGANVVQETLLPGCTYFEPGADGMLCQDKWHVVVATLFEELGWFLAVIAFAVTTTAVSPASKRKVALACCIIGVAFGVFIAFDVKSVLPAASSLLASLATMLWASRRYGKAGQLPAAAIGEG